MRKTAFLLLLPLLCSCNSSGNDPSVFSYSVSDDASRVYVYRNGDMPTPINYQYSLSSVMRSTNGNELISKIADGEDFYLYISQSTCQHCIAVRDCVSQFVQVPSMEVYLLEDSTINPSLQALEKAYPSIQILSTLGTPASYLFHGEAATKVNIVDHASTPSELASYVLPQLNLTNVYTYRTYASYAQSLSQCTIVKEEGSDFYSGLVDSLKHAKKKVSIIEYDALSEEQISAFSAGISGFKSNCVLLNGELIDADNEEEKARSKVLAYLG